MYLFGQGSKTHHSDYQQAKSENITNGSFQRIQLKPATVPVDNKSTNATTPQKTEKEVLLDQIKKVNDSRISAKKSKNLNQEQEFIEKFNNLVDKLHQLEPNITKIQVALKFDFVWKRIGERYAELTQKNEQQNQLEELFTPPQSSKP